MSLIDSIRSKLGLSSHPHHKSLGHALPTDTGADPSRPTIDVTVWVLVDSEGRYVADADPENLNDEYAYQVGKPTFGKPVQLVRMTARLSLPRQIELTATVAGATQ